MTLAILGLIAILVNFVGLAVIIIIHPIASFVILMTLQFHTMLHEIGSTISAAAEIKICFTGVVWKLWRKKLTTYGLTGRMMIMMIMITIQVVWASAYILFVGQRIPRIAVNLTQGQSEE